MLVRYYSIHKHNISSTIKSKDADSTKEDSGCPFPVNISAGLLSYTRKDCERFDL